MTVKVVSEGPTRTMKLECGKCCYMLEYTGEDVKGDSDTQYYIECPRASCKYKSRVQCWSAAR